MNPESENFESLRRLLALKRYEEPPPGYFPRLQRIIITRIEQGEGELSFWGRVSEFFTVRPAVTCALGLAACGVVALNVVWAESKTSGSAQKQASGAWVVIPPTLAAQGAPVDPSQPLHVPNWLGNTNPAMSQEAPSLFNAQAIGPRTPGRLVPLFQPPANTTIETEYSPAPRY